MRLVRLALWPAAVAAGGATAALILSGGIADSPSLTAAIGLAVGLAWSLIGLEEWRRRPGRRIGPLMVFLGFAWFASLLVYSSVSALYTLGLLIRPLFIAVLNHLLLAFPGGRLEGGSRARSWSPPTWTQPCWLPRRRCSTGRMPRGSATSRWSSRTRCCRRR
jgi:peptidoglycan/LPS O-acetylase OafA/YrhL